MEQISTLFCQNLYTEFIDSLLSISSTVYTADKQTITITQKVTIRVAKRENLVCQKETHSIYSLTKCQPTNIGQSLK